jgi:hypothetical protein
MRSLEDGFTISRSTLRSLTNAHFRLPIGYFKKGHSFLRREKICTQQAGASSAFKYSAASLRIRIT